MITKLDKAKVAEAIAQVEQQTTGEIVCVLAKQSDDYRYIPILWAAIVGLAVPLFVLLYDWLFGAMGFYVSLMPSLYNVYFVQLCVFLAVFLMVQWRVLKFALLPKSVMRKRAKRLAAEQFMMQKIHLTAERTGVLLFISVAEKQVEIIADEGIYQKLDPNVWQELLDELICQIKADKMTDGIVQAVSQIGKLLTAHYPADAANNLNELPNHIVILD